MKIGMCMFLWTTHIDHEHEAVLRDIKSVGYDGVEIPIFEGEIADFARIGTVLDEIGLQRTAVSAIGDPEQNLISSDKSHRDAGVDHVRWAIDCAAALGADRLSGPLHSTLGHFSGSGPTREELDRAVETQRRIGDHAANKNVTVCLEALNRFECYLVNTMDALCSLLERIDHPHIQAMYDTFHANIEECDPIAALVDHRQYVKHIHISENDRGVPGRGNLPWEETFAAIRDIGYDDWLTIESFGRGLPDLAAATKVWRDFAESPDAVYRDGYRHIRQCMDTAGLA